MIFGGPYGPPVLYQGNNLNFSAQTGFYQYSESFLNQLDSRIKVVATLILIVLIFSASTWSQLLVIAFVAAVALRQIAPIAGPVWRMLWLLRWLLLFTFLMHLLLTPGRTLWGSSWLFYDGLLVGSFVCLQLLLSVLVASIMARTTSVESIVGAFGWCVSPLNRLGVQTAGWQKILLLALKFIPVVHDQIKQTKPAKETAENGKTKTISARWSAWSLRLKSFVMRLVEQGDEMAHELAEEDHLLQSCELPCFLPLALLDRLFLFSLSFALCIYWLLGVSP